MPVRKRTLVDEKQTVWQISQRRACAILQFDPKSYRHQSRRPEPAALEKRINKICRTRMHYRYSRDQDTVIVALPLCSDETVGM